MSVCSFNSYIYTCEHYVAADIKCQGAAAMWHLRRAVSTRAKESRATRRDCPAQSRLVELSWLPVLPRIPGPLQVMSGQANREWPALYP